LESLNQFRIEFKYIRRAKRAVLRVKPGGLIRVSIPYGVRRADIENWIKSKTGWILEKHRLIESAQPEHSITLLGGDLIPFLGEQVTLKLVLSQAAPKRGEIKRELDQLVISSNGVLDEHAKRKLVMEWYKAEALKRAKERVQFFCGLLNVNAKTVNLKNYKSRWGACSSKGEIIFNWQIILFTPEMFDYVAAHEVCHLIEMNHSPRFYGYLKQLGFDKAIQKKFKNLKNVF
jgi:predicted metal-dependent hydrolase